MGRSTNDKSTVKKPTYAKIPKIVVGDVIRIRENSIWHWNKKVPLKTKNIRERSYFVKIGKVVSIHRYGFLVRCTATGVPEFINWVDIKTEKINIYRAKEKTAIF